MNGYNTPMLSGSLVALVTPFSRGGRIDFGAIDRLVDWHLAEGTEGIVPCGTTGEASTLSPEEYRAVIHRVVRRVRARVPVVAGAGANDTARAVALARLAARARADGLLVVTPYYNKPNQEGLYRHYAAIVRAVALPLVIYNVPSRTGISLSVDTIERLSRLPRVAAIKEATGSVDFASAIALRCRLPILSGTDSMNLPLLAIGAVGAISVVANVAPRLTQRMIQAARAGDADEARRLHFRLYPLSQALFLEGNPIPVKAALSMMELCADTLRLPLSPLSARHRVAVRKALSHAGIGLSKRA